MLDEEKIRLMTRISIYEKEQEHDELVLSHYYREDYVRYGCLRTLVVATLTYWSVVAMYVLYRFQELLREINSMDYFDVIKKLMLGYMGFVAILYVFGFVVYHIRFQLAKKGLIEYNRNLKRYLRWEERNESRQEIEGGFVRISGEIGGDDPEINVEDKQENKKDETSGDIPDTVSGTEVKPGPESEENTEENKEIGTAAESKPEDGAGSAKSEMGSTEVKPDEVKPAEPAADETISAYANPDETKPDEAKIEEISETEIFKTETFKTETSDVSAEEESKNE